MSATSLLPTFKPNGSRAALKQMMPFALRCYMTAICTSPSTGNLDRQDAGRARQQTMLP